jgi:hypothetical protein
VKALQARPADGLIVASGRGNKLKEILEAQRSGLAALAVLKNRFLCIGNSIGIVVE